MKPHFLNRKPSCNSNTEISNQLEMENSQLKAHYGNASFQGEVMPANTLRGVWNRLKHHTIKSAWFLSLLILSSLSGCNNTSDTADAYGNFEADETLISAESSGKVLSFTISEGQTIEKGELIAEIDSTQLVLKKKQLRAAIAAIRKKLPNEEIQLATIDEKLRTIESEKGRLERLVADNAAPQKQLDDLVSQIEVVKREREATANNLATQRQGMLAEIAPLKVQIEQLNDQINRCKVSNPIQGTVLNTFVHQNEMTGAGRPLYSIASLNPLILRAYITEPQLALVKIGTELDVMIDAGEGLRTLPGKLTWINNEAEFTPKMIQTRDERANQVYAIKIEVPNDGSLKIGMPAEVKFTHSTQE